MQDSSSVVPKLDRSRDVVDDSTLTSAAPPSCGKLEPIPGWHLGGDDGRRFVLLERLGGGGMSVVFLARDTVLDRKVAIKFLIREMRNTSDALARLQLEARACARLNHENIVRLFDMGTDRGLPFLVMEHLEGRPLDAIVRDGSIDARRVVRVMIDVAKGLAQAHRAGILHRDLKPSNVFITKDGTAKILDFGVAAMAHDPGALAEELWGTPRYMSPEQWRGEAQDGRTDIWAAGVMFFELLTGSSPFEGASLAELREAVGSRAPAPSLRRVRPELPEEAEPIAQRAMKKCAAERFANADELLDALVKLEVALDHVMRTRHDEAERGARPKPEMRQVTVVSCALDDFPALPGERGLDELTASLDDFFDVCTTIVRELEGTSLSLLGPRFLACFGYPTAHEDNAPRALRAALLIVDAMRTRRAVRVGVATSLSIARRTERTTASVVLQADALDLATWLERRAGRGEIVIGPVTEALVQRTFELEPRGEAVPDGRTQPVRYHRVLGPKSARFDWVGHVPKGPLVGRDRELAQLRELSSRVEAGQGQFVLIAGEAGIGKSRILAQHLEAQHLERTAAEAPGDDGRPAGAPAPGVVRCQCWPHFQHSALEPILEGLLRTLGVRRDTATETKIALLEAALTRASLSIADHLPLLARFLGVPTSDRDAPSFASPALLKQRLQGMLVALLANMAATQPVVVVVEDAHWSDTSTLELLELLLQRMPKARLMVIVTARPEFDPPWPHSPPLHRITLSRLSSEQTSAMIAFASQGRSLPPAIVEQLVQRTDGIPLFVEELTRHIATTFDEAKQRGRLMPLDAFASGTIPATLEGLLRARLEALPREGREVARVAAVLGRDATYETMERVSRQGGGALRIGLMQLVEMGILQRQSQGAGAAYTFNHGLLREAAYQSLVKNERRELHQRAADTLVEHVPDVAGRNPEIVATHFMEAGSHEQASAYFEKAGVHAAARLANTDAAAHYARAIAQLHMLPESEARNRRELALQLARGMALIAAKGAVSAEAHAPYARVRELAPTAWAGDVKSFQSMFGLSQFYLVSGHIEAATGIARDLVTLAGQSGDDTLSLLAHAALGPCLSFLGRFEEARGCDAAGFALYDAEKHRKLCMRIGFDPGVVLLMFLGETLWFLGSPDRALERALAAVALAREVEHPFSLLIALNHLANCYGNRGEYEELLRISEEGIRISEKHGLGIPPLLARGWGRVGVGERGGLADLEESVTVYHKGSVRVGFSHILGTLTWAQWRMGALDGALRTLDEMASFIAATGERRIEAEMHRLRGEVLVATEADPSLVHDAFERGLAIAQSQHARALELRLAHGYARFLANQSRPAEARDLLAPIAATFTEGGDTVDVRRARELLATLGSGPATSKKDRV
ncbi:protein kinase domain-containing protein [Pendulispora albinea]|uniref:Protein kinase n=1 Tax=Pendulispora albinea TaxID=2741071 RepID=A0ABZ2M1K3_9BACT